MKITYYATESQYNAATRGKKTPRGSMLKRLPGRLAKRKALSDCY